MTLMVGLQHVQVPCPAGSEETLRRFYGQILGMAELSRRSWGPAEGRGFAPAPARSTVVSRIRSCR
jgi:hypothetical protein